ncbi:MAG: adenylate/guanylate cyclase domain-containing protein [Acidobacteriota bacterium]|nr:MAG: adenylate/guanylate cyclase domain-containing protein [Acidobacteriota bacterium]
MNPETRYARTKDGQYVAYQVFGHGAVDLVFIPDWVTNLEIMWEEPTLARFLNRLASFSRVICFDKRGSGVSDPVPLGAIPTWEEWMYDVGTVMQGAGSERAAIFGHGDGGQMALLFAATNPGKTSALVLADAYARRARAPDYPCGIPPEPAERTIRGILDTWGTGEITHRGGAPSLADNASFVAWRGRYERLAMSPGHFLPIYPRTYHLDFRSILPSIRVPTLVLHRTENNYIRIDNGRYLAEHIQGAKFVAIAGADHFFHAGDTEAMLGPVEEFLTGTKAVHQEDRVLATVMFTDIVGATAHAERLGDRGWRDLLERHHELVRAELARYRGREIDTAGDGFFATFEGPARGVRCALAIREAVQPLGLEIRAGLHTGECELVGGKVGGIAVHIGARVMSHADAGQVLVSRTVKDLVAGSDLDFVEHGVYELKGVTGEWELFVAS